MPIKIIVNSQEKTLDKTISVANLLAHYNVNASSAAVELNLKIVDKKRFKNTLLKDKDSIEIVQFVGGG